MGHLTERDFLTELAAQARALRQEIEAHQRGLDPAPAAVQERRRRVLSGDFRFFAYTYFPHHVRGEPSRFQDHFCRRFPGLLTHRGGLREWWVAPRGEAKSSLLTKIGPVWIHVQALLQHPDVRRAVGWRGEAPPFLDYITLLGAETRMPTKLMEVSKTELTANAALALDFPEVCGQGPVWKVGEYVSRTGVKVEPFGAEQAIRGTFFGASRPKVLLGDDLITDKEAKSPTERENRWTWLTKAIDYLGPPDGSAKFIAVGTILNTDDPISRARRAIGHTVHVFKAIERMPDRMDLWEQCEALMRNEDPAVIRRHADQGQLPAEDRLPSWQFYVRRRAHMDAGAVISWPSVRSLYALMRSRAANPRAFGTEMQAEPISDEDLVFPPERVRYWVSKLPHWIHFGACDPSMGKGQSSHPSAIIVGAWCRAKKQLHVEHADSKRRVPSKLLADLLAAQREYQCGLWGFENNNAYEHMRSSFVDQAIDAGVNLPLMPYTAVAPPEVRIDSLEPVICGLEPRILVHASLSRLLAQLGTWPLPQNDHHYDLLVALHILWVVASSRGMGMPDITTRRRPAAINMQGYDDA